MPIKGWSQDFYMFFIDKLSGVTTNDLTDAYVIYDGKIREIIADAKIPGGATSIFQNFSFFGTDVPQAKGGFIKLIKPSSLSRSLPFIQSELGILFSNLQILKNNTISVPGYFTTWQWVAWWTAYNWLTRPNISITWPSVNCIVNDLDFTVVNWNVTTYTNFINIFKRCKLAPELISQWTYTVTMYYTASWLWNGSIIITPWVFSYNWIANTTYTFTLTATPGGRSYIYFPIDINGNILYSSISDTNSILSGNIPNSQSYIFNFDNIYSQSNKINGIYQAVKTAPFGYGNVSTHSGSNSEYWSNIWFSIKPWRNSIEQYVSASDFWSKANKLIIWDILKQWYVSLWIDNTLEAWFWILSNNITPQFIINYGSNTANHTINNLRSYTWTGMTQISWYMWNDIDTGKTIYYDGYGLWFMNTSDLKTSNASAWFAIPYLDLSTQYWTITGVYWTWSLALTWAIVFWDARWNADTKMMLRTSTWSVTTNNWVAWKINATLKSLWLMLPAQASIDIVGLDEKWIHVTQYPWSALSTITHTTTRYFWTSPYWLWSIPSSSWLLGVKSHISWAWSYNEWFLVPNCSAPIWNFWVYSYSNIIWKINRITDNTLTNQVYNYSSNAGTMYSPTNYCHWWNNTYVWIVAHIPFQMTSYNWQNLPYLVNSYNFFPLY